MNPLSSILICETRVLFDFLFSSNRSARKAMAKHNAAKAEMDKTSKRIENEYNFKYKFNSRIR